jgi:imidazolonepropionase-like amidohydrolase
MNTIVTPLKKSISMLNRIAVLSFLSLGVSLKAQTLYQNATIHIGNGKVLENASMLINGADILWVGTDDSQPNMEIQEIVNLADYHVYPGFIAPATATGLVEVEAVRATVDFREVGRDNPNARAAVAFNTDSRILPTLVANGVLLVQSAPEGGTFSGLSSVMRLSARNWEEAVVFMDDGMHINWPSPLRYNWAKGRLVTNDDYAKQLDHVVHTLKDAKAYLSGSRSPINLKLEAFAGMFSGTKKAFVHTNHAPAMLEAVNELKALGVNSIVIVGGADSHRIADFLRENKVAIILRRTHELPVRADDAIDLPYRTPALLHEAGVDFCLSNIGRMPVMGNRNIPFMAGTAVAYGLPPEEAVAMISGNAARILGIDDRYGTLEAGKSATFFVSKGDALDAISQNLVNIYIDGVRIPVKNWQNELFERWDKVLHPKGE